MKKTLTILLLLACFAAAAQPGYMGKKFSIGYKLEATARLDLALAIVNFDPYDGAVEEVEPLRVIIGHYVNASYVLSRRHEFYAEAGVRNMQYEAFSKEFTSSNYDTFEPSRKTVKAHEQFAEIGLRRYFGNSIAPVGTFHQLAIGITNVGYDKSVKSITGKIDNETLVIPVNDVALSMPRISYGIGGKKILTGSLWVSAEANIHVFLIDGIEILDGQSYSSPGKYAEDVLQENFYKNRRFDLKIGVGFIL